MNTPTIQLVTHEVHRLVVPIPTDYDETIRLYERLVPRYDAHRFGQLATWNAVLELAQINAPLGFMIYGRTDVTSVMAGSGAGWRCTAYLMGNHTIAERMFRHDPSAMLHAPLRTVIYAGPIGDTQLAIDQPSSLFSSYADERITAVGQHLDQLVADLLAHMRAPVPAQLQDAVAAAEKPI
jgi:uncharacterized protein (DUF302 family)